MKNVKPWASALQVAPEKYSTWTVEVPKHESLTFYCLERGLIRSNEYFSWAKEYYGLSMVDSDYFKQPANRELWQQIQSVANWNPALLPLEMWDGVVFVACVEPPEEIQWSFPVQYVLAHPRDLKLYLERLEDDPTRIGQSVFTSTSFRTASQANLRVKAEIEPPPAPPPAPTQDAPVGITLALAESLSEEDEDQVTSPSIHLHNVDAPEGLSLTPDMLKIETPSSDLPPLSMPEGLGHTPPKVPPSAPRTAPPMRIEASTQAAAQKPEHPSQVMKGYEIDSDHLAASSVDAAQSPDEAMAWVFLQMKQHFLFSWMFFYHGSQLSPWRWDKGVQPKKEAALAPLDLSSPSLFRIVVRSKMPYHGHVIENPVNSGFFKVWGLRSPPEHVTAIPLMSGDHLIGVLLGAGAKSANTDQVLHFMERMGSAAVRSFSIKKAA